MTLNSCFPSIRLTLTQAESGRSPSECSRSNFLLDDCKASWCEVGIVESARLWFQWRSGHVSASLSARRTRTYGPACGGRPESRRNTRRAAAHVDETDVVRFPDAVFLERIDYLPSSSRASSASNWKVRKVRRRTNASEKYAARFFAAASLRSTAISYLFHSFLKRPQSAAMSPPSFSGDGAGMVFTADAAIIDGDDIV